MFFKNDDLMSFKLVVIFQINNFKLQKLNWMSTFMSKLLFFEKVHNWMLNFKNFRIDKADFLTAKEQKRSIIMKQAVCTQVVTFKLIRKGLKWRGQEDTTRQESR